MNTKKVSIICICLCIKTIATLRINPIFKKNKTLKSSLIIPCYPKHAPLLYPLLKIYTKQARLPDEVVISLSEINKVPQAILTKLNTINWPFTLKLLTSQKYLLAGSNRNRAAQHSSGNVIICQDADDIPHPQRVEIIMYFFENFGIDHLMHLCTKKENHRFEKTIKNNLKFLHYRDYKKTLSKSLNNAQHDVTNGNIACTRKICDEFKWRETRRPEEDTLFNQRVYENSNKCIIIPEILLIYKMSLSSWRKK
jgi:hypothetical protein